MADLKLLGLALANAQGGYNASLQGEKDAMAMDTLRRQQQEQMMELALKDAFYEDRQAQMGLELLMKMPVRNEARINQELSLAEDPLMRVMGPSGPGAYDATGAQRYIDAATGRQPVRTMDVPSVGLGARMIDQGVKTGQRPAPPAPRELSPQESSIEKLRLMEPQRSPQSEMNIVQPLEGDYRPGMGADGVQQLEPSVVEGDPNAERALNFVSGNFKGSPYSALRNPEFRRMMFDSMARTGSVPGLMFQTQSTMDALKGIGDARFLAAKQAATLNQQSQEIDAKLQAAKAEAEMQNYTRAADLAAKAGDADAERQLRQMIEMFRGIVDVYKTNVPKPRSSSSKEDPNAVDYRKQLNQLQTNLRASTEAQIKQFGGFVSTQRRAKIMKDILKNDPTIAGLASELRAKAGQYPAIANNYSGLFSELGMPLGGAAPKSGNSGAEGPKTGRDRLKEVIQKRQSTGTSPRG